MTLASFFLVTFERESKAAQRAGLKYFVVNQAAALGMLAAGLLLWRAAGSFAFPALRAALAAGVFGDSSSAAKLARSMENVRASRSRRGAVSGRWLFSMRLR